jgi:hypothetical protein
VKRLLWTLAFVFVAIETFAQVPNDFQIPQRLFATGLYDLKTHDGQGAFVDAVVATLHAKNQNWRHLKKKPGQTAVHGHAEDAALFLLPNDTAIAVDFIGGAGGTNPQPGWIVGTHAYKHSDAHDPDDHGLVNKPPVVLPPQYPPYPFPETAIDGAGEALFADFAEAGQNPNSQMFRFAFRVAYDWLTKNVADLNASVAKHREQWRMLLGLP